MVQFRSPRPLLNEQIAYLRKQLFGAGKSEKLNNAQLLLKLEALEEQVKAAEQPRQKIAYERAKPKQRQAPAEHFKHLPVKETVELIPDEVKADPDLYERIGEQETFEVDIIPPQLFKRLIVRPKYKHKFNKDLPPIIAPAPKRAVDGGYASAGLLAWIVLSKYVDHQPLYRQEKMSVRWGAKLSRKTMADWVQVVAQWLKPIYNHMRDDLLEGGYVQADETPVNYMDPDLKKAKARQGWMWAISRPDADVVFDWRLSRRHGELTSLLNGYEGILQSDAYEAYISFARNNENVFRVGCWAHARRKFHEALDEAPVQAGFILRLIAQLYALEKQWNKEGFTDPAQRAHLRERDFSWTLSLLKKAAELLLKRELPQGRLGRACAYLLKEWSALVSICALGQVHLDDNHMENAIRPSAVGKKNWLFIGSAGAGDRSAIIYSVVVSCQRRGIDPLVYLRDVLSRLPSMTNQDDMSLLAPAHWSPSEA